MLSRLLKTINMSTKIMILLILIVSILISKNLYLILFITVLGVIILIITNRNVNFYIEIIKNNYIWLLFFSIMYIIIFRNIFQCLVLLYKFILIMLYLKIFVLNLDFKELDSGIYRILYPLKNTKVDIKKVSYNISIYIYYIIYFLNSKREIKLLQSNNVEKNYGIKKYLFPRLLISISKISELEDKLKLKFYETKKEKSNFKSGFILCIFVIFFIMVMLKEI